MARAAQAAQDSARKAIESWVRVAPLADDTLRLRRPIFLGTLSGWPQRLRDPNSVASALLEMARRRATEVRELRWQVMVTRSLTAHIDSTVVAQVDTAPRPAPAVPVRPDTTNPLLRGQLTDEAREAVQDYGISVSSRLEGKAQRTRNERCTATQLTIVGNNCFGSYQPGMDFQFTVRSGGVVADRVHVNVDYESTREFDASNNISVFYQGKTDELINRIEVGNVSLQMPASRFITSGIPAGNYGLQMTGQVGPMRFTSIVANQKGNVSKDNVFTVGDRTLQQVERTLEDIQIEPRRFFFTVDPRQFAGYPNIDVLNRTQMQQLAGQLPDSIRPVRVFVYRQLISAQNQNPRGPQLSVRGAQNPSRQIYQLLRENVDYYIDPSQLWIALVGSLNPNNERLAIAYEVNVNGVRGRNVNTGGTPDVEFTESPQFANLLWEPELQPNNPGYFLREIKSFYRLGGEDLRLETVNVKLVTGLSGDQEKPVDPSRGETYLQVFGLSQATNPNQFDVENRIWPRQNDPNFNAAGGANQKLIRDYFLTFPSVQPFARAGLARPAANPSNDTIYSYPNEYLYSAQRPQAIFRMMARYMAEGGARDGAVTLGSLQIRPNSERVVIDGRILQRDIDYNVDYTLGRITFSRPDTLFPTPRQVSVRYEENPLFTALPTNIFGFTSMFPLERGQLSFTAISQQQRSGFNRPPLGFEPVGSFVAGVTGNMAWDAQPLSNLVGKLPFGNPRTRSGVAVQAEFAMSKPQPNAAGQAYIESFEADAGSTPISLSENAWYFSSAPAPGSFLPQLLGSNPFTLNRASTMVYQNNAFDIAGNVRTFTLQQIDPAVRLQGRGVQSVENVLWMTLYPLRTGGIYDFVPGSNQRRFAWMVGENTSLGPTPTGRRWRSVRTVLDASGRDLSRTENIEFFVLVNSEDTKRFRNPTLVFDFGELSENTVSFAPETLVVNPPVREGLRPDTTYFGKRLVGYNRFDSERDPFSRAFNQLENDIGLPGDRADTIVVINNNSGDPSPRLAFNVPLCQVDQRTLPVLSDSRANCTRGNNRLDEEDIDLDGQLNMRDTEVDREQLRRYVVDLSIKENWARTGHCTVQQNTDAEGRVVSSDSLCWVQVRLNWRAPAEVINNPNDRRMRAMRMTMISNSSSTEADFPRIALAQFKLVGAPWLKRSERPLTGLAGDSSATLGGYVIASVVGTQDSSEKLAYQPPPGVIERPENQQTEVSNNIVQVNERAMRLQAGVPGTGFRPFDRAEAYFRFPEGTKTFMGYRTLRLWMRGRGNGWGMNGEMNGYIKLGRDEHNFYMYRTPVNSGVTQSAWDPEVRIDLERFQILRSRLENTFLTSSPDSLQCTGVDLELIRRSGLPRTQVSRRYAVCQDGYIVYTTDPSVTPPNLAGVQELAVGMIRIDSIPRAGDAVLPNDTLELWINDIRLTDVVDDIGFAGEFAMSFNTADLADFRINLSRRDPNFRQLGENPSFLATNGLSFGTTLHLERMLPAKWGIVMPLSIDHSGVGVQQLFINRSDVRASGIDALRNPRDRRTNYTLALRRSTPLEGGWYAPIVNGLSLSGTWGGSSSKTAFQELDADNYVATASLGIASDRREDALPRPLTWIIDLFPRVLRESDLVRGFREQKYRWAPASFRVSSSLARSASTTTSYLKVAESATDTGQVVQGLSHLWRNAATLEMRPTANLVGRFDATQLLDLRDYSTLPVLTPDSIDRRVAARAERLNFLGADVGLERERSFNSVLTYQPSFGTWFRPNFSWTGNFSLVKDPNGRALLREGDTLGAYRLPNRLGAFQTVSANAMIDLGRYVSSRTSDSSLVRRIASVFGPTDVQWSSSLSSNYDNTAFMPNPAFQFGLGGVDDFRGLNTRLASSAGRVRRVALLNQVNLPFGLTLNSRVEDGSSETWTRRSLDGFQALIRSDQLVFPNVDARWLLRPQRFRRVFNAMTLGASYRETTQDTRVPNETGGIADQSSFRSVEVPLSASVSWAFLGGITTNGSFRRAVREEVRPGSVTDGESERMSFDMTRTWRLPKKWNTRGNLQTRVSWEQEEASSSVSSLSIAEPPPEQSILPPSILTNNGRRALNFSANTDLSETMNFSITGSQVLTFDRNFNRRISSTVLSVVLRITFFAGEMR